MFAVIFVVEPQKGHMDDYLNQAKLLKPELEKIDGFMDNERFNSLTRKREDGRVLSLSRWKDEKSLIRWRTLGMHHVVQIKGRNGIFDNYHLRVGEIISDTQLPKDQKIQPQRLDTTEMGESRFTTISEFNAGQKPATADLAHELELPEIGADGIVEYEVFEGITNPGKRLLLTSWRNEAMPEAWIRKAPGGGESRHRCVRIIRTYGMFERQEAPQYYPTVKKP
jgi:heme-degrading monooxygenase HmoA